jgi:putative membrane protein
MPHILFRRFSLALTLVYCAAFPGSTITLALDAVPAWGEWMGGALLVVQGLAVLCWAPGVHGARGGAAVAAALVLAWAVEHVGETTGFPFGRYRYTEALQPQILDVVPAPIALAWLMAAFGSWQLARMALGARTGLPLLALTGALIVALDLQIETVATAINPYWVWLEPGPYYGVPAANFAAWWAVGVLMGLLLSLALDDERRATSDARRRRSRWSRVRRTTNDERRTTNDERRTTNDERRTTNAGEPKTLVVGHWSLVIGRWSLVTHRIPALLYLLSSVMFTVVNFARGYPLAGLVGTLLLAGVALYAARTRLKTRTAGSLKL